MDTGRAGHLRGDAERGTGMKNLRSRNPHMGRENAYVLKIISLFPLLRIAGTKVRPPPGITTQNASNKGRYPEGNVK